MITLMLMMALSCPDTKIENWTKQWTDYDQKTLDHAKVRCSELYPEAPCLKLFRKKDSTTYNAICGEKK